MDPMPAALTRIGPPKSAVACHRKLSLRCMHQIAYNAGTMSKQYTIRSVPAAVDRALRRRAKQESKSLNTVVLEAIVQGLALEVRQADHTDLDSLIGSWQDDPAFDRAVADFKQVDEQVWK